MGPERIWLNKHVSAISIHPMWSESVCVPKDRYTNYEYIRSDIAETENKRLREALERLITGEAVCYAGMIPKEFQREHSARCDYIRHILDGDTIEQAITKACDKQHKEVLAALKGD